MRFPTASQPLAVNKKRPLAVWLGSIAASCVVLAAACQGGEIESVPGPTGGSAGDPAAGASGGAGVGGEAGGASGSSGLSGAAGIGGEITGGAAGAAGSNEHGGAGGLAGSPGTGGVAGNAGSGETSGSAGVSGTAGTGGANGTGGAGGASAGAGGSAGTGGANDTGGAGGVSVGAGGTAAAGFGGSAGTAGGSGAIGTGGSAGAAGGSAGTGGLGDALGTGGAAETGGTGGTDGAVGTGGTAGESAGTGGLGGGADSGGAGGAGGDIGAGGSTSDVFLVLGNCVDALGAPSFLMPPGQINFDGDTRDAGADITIPAGVESCNPEVLTDVTSGEDQVFALTPAVDGTLTVVVIPTTGRFNPVLYVDTTCSSVASTLTCADERASAGRETISFAVMSGQTYYVVIDSSAADHEGSYRGTVQLTAPLFTLRNGVSGVAKCVQMHELPAVEAMHQCLW